MHKPLSVLVTGGQGFVGSALSDSLSKSSENRVTVVQRRPEVKLGMQQIVMELKPDSDLTDVLKGIDVVIHTAARVHMMRDNADDPLAEFRHSNTFTTLNLARQSAAAGIRRFIFLSSIKVMGEKNSGDTAFRADQPANPEDPYALSKHEAEQGLLQIGKDSGMEIVIIRPPLIYGKGVKANFQRLIHLMQKQIPLPFKLVRNRRSLLGLPNLVSLIECCMRHPSAANQIFLASDNHDLSTPELMQSIAKASMKRAYLWPCPPSLLQWGAGLVGQRAAFERLCGDLRIDVSPTMSRLQWTPPMTPAAIIAESVAAELTESV